jgi:hypothetical protein
LTAVEQHARLRVSETDDWHTPPHIVEALGLEFDLDPCGPPGGVPWLPVRRTISLPDDGLAMPWEGRVWLNPPYSNPAPWMERMALHGNGVALIFNRSDTSWYQQWVPAGSALCQVAGRLRFHRPGEGPSKEPAPAPSVLVSYGEECAAAVLGCGLGMRFKLGGDNGGWQGVLWA